jgi:hypothetical protein
MGGTVSSVAALLLRSWPSRDTLAARGLVVLTEKDVAWLESARGKKQLDASTVVVRVAARHVGLSQADDGGGHGGEPRVVECYPLRRADHALRTGGKFACSPLC